MTKRDRLRGLIRSTFEPVPDGIEPPDVWPLRERRCAPPPKWTRVDIVLAAAVVFALVVFPKTWILLAHHL
jgi:hypothetical protein